VRLDPNLSFIYQSLFKNSSFSSVGSTWLYLPNLTLVLLESILTTFLVTKDLVPVSVWCEASTLLDQEHAAVIDSNHAWVIDACMHFHHHWSSQSKQQFSQV